MKLFASDTIGRLQAGADTAIWRSHANTAQWPARRDPTRKPPEEDYVAAFVLNALPAIADAWRPIFQQRGLRLSLTGVFCHNTPKASFEISGAPQSPELADLLIVRRHTEKHGLPRQVAVLVQAKMSDDGQIRLPHGDTQLHLYTNWPTFELRARNAPNTKFSIGRNARQALYSGIRTTSPRPSDNDSWASFCPWALMPPQQRGWVEVPLSTFLVRLLNFEAGREFFDLGIVGCHWSELIHFLLQSTFALPLRTSRLLKNP